MTFLLQLAAFVLGVWMSIRTIAALYLVLDLWYAIGTHWGRVVASIAGWAALVAVSAWLLPPGPRAAFGWGLVAFLGFYLSLFALRYPLLRLLARQRERES